MAIIRLVTEIDTEKYPKAIAHYLLSHPVPPLWTEGAEKWMEEKQMDYAVWMMNQGEGLEKNNAEAVTGGDSRR